MLDIDEFKCFLESCEYISPDEITPNNTLIIKHKCYTESAPTNWYICNEYMVTDNRIMCFNLSEIEIIVRTLGRRTLGRKTLVYIPDDLEILPKNSRLFYLNEIYILRLTDSAKLLLELSKDIV